MISAFSCILYQVCINIQGRRSLGGGPRHSLPESWYTDYIPTHNYLGAEVGTAQISKALSSIFEQTQLRTCPKVTLCFFKGSSVI